MSRAHHVLRWELALVLLTSAASAQTVAEMKAAVSARGIQAMPEDTAELLVFLKPGEDVQRFAKDRGMTVKHALRSDPNAYVLTAPNIAAARQIREAARTHSAIRDVSVNQRTRYVKMAFVPDDPYFHKNTPANGWPGQWHLVNEYVAGRDARVQGAWNRDITGSGVLIGIVDDSLETAHPDLAPNYVAADSWDFGQNDNNPSPVYTDDQHGVSVSGVAAARGGNGIGVTGAAPYAGLAGLRIDFAYQTTQMFVDATLYHSSGSNTNIKVKNHSYGYGVPYIKTDSEVNALNTSTAAGTIHCVAAGNERSDANTRDLQKSPNSISVAALGSNGKFAHYSNFGGCVTACSPSSSSGYYSITTTDRTGTLGYNGSDAFPDVDYTSAFGGTSSASPLAAGVMALVKQAQPALNTRFAKHLLAMTSDVVDADDATATSGGGWVTNAAGFHFNHNYGFGLIDADELTAAATDYVGVTGLSTEQTSLFSVNATIPDGSSTGVTRTFTINATAPLEEILVYLKITHTWRGDVEAWLTSPSGTVGRVVMGTGSDSGDNIDWTFTCNQFWGENPAGTWTLKVLDVYAADIGTWNSFRVTARMGGLVSVPATAGYGCLRNGSFEDGFEGGIGTAWTQFTAAGTIACDASAESLSGSWAQRVRSANSYNTGGIYQQFQSEPGQQYTVSAWIRTGSATVMEGWMGVDPAGGTSWSAVPSLYKKSTTSTTWSLQSVTATATSNYMTVFLYARSTKINTAGYVYFDDAGPECLFAPPAITVQPVSQNVCLAETAAFAVSAAGTWPLIYQWQKNGVNLSDGDRFSGTNTDTLVISSVDIGDEAGYRCVVTNSYGTSTSNSAALWLKTVTAITQQPTSLLACESAPVQFSVTAQMEGLATYQWSRGSAELVDDGRVSGSQTATLTITAIHPDDAGEYRCTVSAECGSVTSEAAVLTLKPRVGPDLNGDCDVDSGDFALFVACLSGPTVSVASGCDDRDFDADGDVDQVDFGLMQRCFSGANQAPLTGCDN